MFFINHLQRSGYEVVINDDMELIKGDIWFIDFYRDNNEAIRNFFSKHESKILTFKNKICLYSLDDIGDSYANLLSSDLLERIDGWLVSVLHDKGTAYGANEIYNKLILFPRYIIPYRQYTPIAKKQQLMFYGHPTNPNRIKALELLKQSGISNKFIGGIVVHNLYNSEFKNITIPSDIKTEYIDLNPKFDETLLSICLPGITSWTYRHISSMQSNCGIISCNVKEQEGRWLYDDKIEDEFFYIEPDMSNLIEVCEYTLSNIAEVTAKANRGNNIYKNFFELNPNGTFKFSIWNELKDSFSQRGINFINGCEDKTIVNAFGDWWGHPTDETRGGWWGDGHTEFFNKLIKTENIKRICEIGTYMGRSTHFFAKMLPLDGEIVTIDTFKGSPEHYNDTFFKQINNLYLTATINLKLGANSDKIRIINRKSMDAEVPDDYFDLVYIDGRHDTQSVINDIVKFKQSLKSGGILSGDDYVFASVKEAVGFCVDQKIIPPIQEIYNKTIWWTKI